MAPLIVVAEGIPLSLQQALHARRLQMHGGSPVVIAVEMVEAEYHLLTNLVRSTVLVRDGADRWAILVALRVNELSKRLAG